MARNFPVEVVPLRLVKASSHDNTVLGGLLWTGWTMESTWEELPHRYVVDSTDVLRPEYMGEYKKKWVVGSVQVKTLLGRYPEDGFVQQCRKVDIRREPSCDIASMMETEGEKVILVRVVTPVKIRIHGFLHKQGQLHQK